MVEDEHSFEISPHGCFHTDLIAKHNATVSGRVALPPGFEVEGTSVEAIDLHGRAVASGDADPDGRYTIVGLASGDYVIGIHAGRFPPTPAAPFPATFAPSSADREHASKVHVDTGTHLEDIDIFVNAASQTATIRLQATFDDGTPLTEGRFELGLSGFGEHTDSSGGAVLQVVRGRRGYLSGGATTEGGIGKCMTPLAVGPDAYPEVLEVTLSEEGCRQSRSPQSVNCLRRRKRQRRLVHVSELVEGETLRERLRSGPGSMRSARHAAERP